MTATPNRQRILIVDDDPLNCKVLSAALMRDYQVLTAANGAQALQLAQRKPAPDLILLDIMMPEMDGNEVLGCLKDNPETADIPVIFITALDGHKNEIEGLELGAVDYLTKPIHMPMVRARVHTHLELKRHRDLLHEQTEQYAQAYERLKKETEARQEMATALRVSELKYRQVFENSASATIIFDEKNTIVMANGKCEALSGYLRRELEGARKWTDFIHEEDLAGLKTIMAQYDWDEGQGYLETELRFIDKNKKTRDIFVQVAPMPDSNKWIASWIDITERRRAQKALHENQTYLKAILETIETGVLISDPETGAIQDINPHGARLIGATVPELIGRNARTLLDGDRQVPILEGQTAARLEGSVAAIQTIDHRTIPVRHASTRVELNGRTWAIDSFQEIQAIVELLKSQNLNTSLAKQIMGLINGPLPHRIDLGRTSTNLFVEGRLLSSHAEGGDHFFVRTIPGPANQTNCTNQNGAGGPQTVVSLKDQSGHSVECILRSIATDLIHHTILNGDGNSEPAQAINQLNEIICKKELFNADDFAAALYANIDHQTLQLNYLTAGHPPFLLIRDGRTVILPPQGKSGANLPIGVFAEIDFQTGTYQLQPGDQLLMATDGLLEATLENQGRILTEHDFAQLVEELLTATPAISLAELMDQVLQQVAELSGAPGGDFRQMVDRDDISFLGMELETLDLEAEERFHVQNTAEVSAATEHLLDCFCNTWRQSGYDCPEPRLRMVLEEAMANAWHHGNRQDPAKTVTVRWGFKNGFAFSIEDEGNGFNAADINDPRSPGARLRDCGRGVFIIRQIADWVQWRDNGRIMQAAFARRAGQEGLLAGSAGTIPLLWSAKGSSARPQT